jgi:glycosyltransferase involved in cell wall biosynthesis
VISNGINTSIFKQRTKQYKKTPFKIIQVSRLIHDKKGQDFLIEAAAALKGKIDITFVGEGDSIEFLKSLAREKGVNKYIHFAGKKDQSYIANHLCDYDLFVQPSRYEGFGLTVAEAMAAKVPVLVSSGQGPAEVTCNEKYGWVFKNGDTDDLVQKISYIIEHQDLTMNKALLGLQYVCENYDVSITAKRYIEEYKKFLS